MSERRVVITGIGLATPVGIGAETVWQALLNGKSGIRRISAFDPSRFRSHVGGEIENLNVRDYVPKSYRKSTKVMARDIEIAVAAAYEAVRDAGLKTRCLVERAEVDGPVDVDPTRFGANIGAGLICADLTELAGALATSVNGDGKFDIARWGSEGMNNLTPLWLLKFLPNMLSCHVTIVHDAQAPSNTITCGEASSHLAIGEAYRTVARGAADLCICGGAESKMNPMGLMRQQLLDRVSTRYNDRPERASRPFDADRDGMAISEGGGLLILEELDRARSRGARIYCEVVGFGASNDSRSWHEPDPAGTALALAIDKSLADASCGRDEVDLVSTFGTACRAHDASEAAGLRKAFGDRIDKLSVMATKGATGNNGAGSGAIDVAITAMCLHHGRVPAAQNLDTLDSSCRMNVVTGAPAQREMSIALSESYALGGGQHAALVLRRWED